MTTLKQDRAIPDVTIEVLARNVFRETRSYGFGLSDYLRFVNVVMDLSMRGDATGDGNAATNRVKGNGQSEGGDRPTIRIRPYDRHADADRLARWLEDEKGRYFLFSRHTARAVTLDELANSPATRLGIVLADDASIGCMAYLNLDPDQRKAELRKLIGEPTMRGRGLGKEATRQWIAYGMETLKLHKIYLDTFGTDIRNIRINESLGFRIEGILRDEVFFDGHYHDVLRMGMCR